jgi:hypothetical protein
MVPAQHMEDSAAGADMLITMSLNFAPTDGIKVGGESDHWKAD